MSILIKSIETNNIRGRNVVLFADLKSEVPLTGAETVALIGEDLELNAGDVIYTAALDAAILDTNDEWDWGGGGSSTGPNPSDATPSALGAAAPGSSLEYSRADHVHAMPSAIDVGAEPAITEITVSTNGTVTQALDAGKMYHFTSTLTSLTLTFNAAATGQIAQYHFDFAEGSNGVRSDLAERGCAARFAYLGGRHAI